MSTGTSASAPVITVAVLPLGGEAGADFNTAAALPEAPDIPADVAGEGIARTNSAALRPVKMAEFTVSVERVVVTGSVAPTGRDAAVFDELRGAFFLCVTCCCSCVA